VGFKGDNGRFILTKLGVTDELYKDFTIEGKQSVSFLIHPPANFKFAKIFEDTVFKGIELELLQISTGEKDEDSIEMY
jgi:hypothetical protein